MEKFPNLKDGQFTVVIADGATGYLLNHKGEIYQNNSADEVYWSFDNLDLAKDFVKERSRLNEKIEFLIYDKNQTIVEFIKAKHWN